MKKHISRQVPRLALQISDQLKDLTGLGKDEKFLLLCAAYLHDIEVIAEWKKGHHKIAMRIR
jgi:HD-GYP domain-containing protein (c-di-GMP phosphodiesterase class II)